MKFSRMILPSIIVALLFPSFMIGQAPEASRYNSLRGRSGNWAKLPERFTRELSAKFDSEPKLLDFASLCEQVGILENNLLDLAASAGDDPKYFVSLVASALTSYANYAGGHGQFKEAIRAASHAITLRPRHLPAWSSLAIASYANSDCRTAVYWANQLLEFKPDPNSSDDWDRSIVLRLTSEKARRPTLGPGYDLLSLWQEMKIPMNQVKAACKQ